MTKKMGKKPKKKQKIANNPQTKNEQHTEICNDPALKNHKECSDLIDFMVKTTSSYHYRIPYACQLDNTEMIF